MYFYRNSRKNIAVKLVKLCVGDIAMKKRYGFLALALSIFLLGSVALPDLIYSSAVKVQTVKAERRDVQITKNVLGKICTYGEQEIAVQTDCVIGKMYAKTGDYLKKGEKIAEIDRENTLKMLLQGDSPNSDAAENIPDSIVMPQNGRISKVTESNQFYSGDSICSIIADNSLYLSLNISESIASQIEQSNQLIFTGAAFDGEFDGILSEISPIAQTLADGSSAVTVAAKIKSPNDKLKSGYTVDAKITTDTLKAVLCLPQSAVGQDKGGCYVYTYSNGSAVKTSIKVRCYSDGYAVIDSGVKSGQDVLSDAAKCKKDSEDVIVVNGD